MILPHHYIHYFHYFAKRDADKFYISIAIRNLALGMVVIFEAAYLYEFFGQLLSSTMLYIALHFALYAVLVVEGGKIMARIGTHRSVLASHLFYLAYYVCLFLFPISFLFVPLALIIGSIGMSLFWPAFHTDFVRFSAGVAKGREVGKANVARFFPVIVSPLLGGWILSVYGYPVLFTVVFAVLLSSIIPLLTASQAREVYTDSYSKVWKKIFTKEGWKENIAFASEGLEFSINSYLWPLFMFVLAIGFSQMGGVVSFSLFVSAFFMLYIGRLSDTAERSWLLNIGAMWTSISWILKTFVTTSFDALLAHTVYRVSRSAGSIPFQTFLYEKAAAKEAEADEFLVRRQVLIGATSASFFGILAVFFFFVPSFPLNATFIGAAVLSLGTMFLGTPPKIRLRRAHDRKTIWYRQLHNSDLPASATHGVAGGRPLKICNFVRKL